MLSKKYNHLFNFEYIIKLYQNNFLIVINEIILYHFPLKIKEVYFKFSQN
jgi:hypothetical protein